MTNEQIDKLQTFIENNLYADVPNEVYNQMMADAETLDMAEFNKKWDKTLRDNSRGWKAERVDTNPLSQRVTETFKDDYNPSDNWIEENFPGIPVETVKAELAKIQAANITAKEKQKIADEYKREAEARYARQKAVDDYQHSYLGMDLDNPLNIGLNKLADFIISDKTKRAVVEDPNDAGRIAGNIAVDIGGTAADFIPGVGGYVIGPTIRTGRNIAEGDKASDIVREAALDYGGNIALSQGLKGIPGIGDFGPLRKIEDKTIGKWKEVAENLEKDVDFDNVFTVPSFESKGEFFKWAEKLPPETRKEVQKIVASSSEADVRKNLQGYVKKNVEENIRLSENMPYYKKYAAEHPVQTFVGKTVEPVTVGAERTAAEHGTRTPTEYKTSSPKKIKDYSTALDYIIENNKRQWEAGFKPRDMSGIVGEAYKKWESER